MEKDARLLLARADGLDRVADTLFSRALHSKFKGKHHIGDAHSDNAERVRRKAAKLRKLATRVAAEYFGVQALAEPIGEHRAAV